MQQPPNPPQALLPALPAAQTRDQFDALVNMRGALREQLASSTKRRFELREQYLQSNLAMRGDIESRIKMLDDHAARLEREILRADDAITDAAARGIATQPRRDVSTTIVPRRIGRTDDVIPQVMFLEALAFVFLGFVLWRYAFKRGAAKFTRPAIDQSSRFDQLQQAVDVMAVEIERISEGQRYVAKVLSEKLHVPVGPGEAQQIPLKGKTATPVRTADEST